MVRIVVWLLKSTKLPIPLLLAQLYLSFFEGKEAKA
jgi:hypothetical protein